MGDYVFTFDFAHCDTDPELKLFIVEGVTLSKITLNVKMPDDDTDVTDKCNIVWIDEEDNQIASGNILENSKVGESYKYIVTLKEDSGLTGVYGGYDTAIGQRTNQDIIFRLKKHDQFKLIVKDEEGQDVTDQCDITWYTLKSYVYKVLSTTSELEYKYKPNDIYTYSIEFKDDDWYKEYKLPKDVVLKAKEGSHEVEVNLEKIEKINFKGRIVLKNKTEDSDITQTTILIKQMVLINDDGLLYIGPEVKKIHPDEDGKFELKVNKDAASVSFSHENYETKSLSIIKEDFPQGDTEYSCEIELEPKSCANYYAFLFKYGTKTLYANPKSFSFELHDEDNNPIDFYFANDRLTIKPDTTEGYPVGKKLILTVKPSTEYVYADYVIFHRYTSRELRIYTMFRAARFAA